MPGALELRLGESGVLAYGYAVHVPQYLAQFRYPRASIRLLTALTEGTGLSIATAALEAQAVKADEEIAAYLEGSSELRELVSALEVRYDAVHAAGDSEWDVESLPSGEEIAAALQSYLADQSGNPDEPR